MRIDKISYLFLVGVGTMLTTSCIKDAAPALGDRGATIVKFLESPENKFFFEPFSNTKYVSLFSLRKDAATNADLNTETVVKIRSNPTLITDYNTDNGTNFEILPDSLYTLVPGITKSGQIYTMPLKAGDFAMDFGIQLNGGKWDLAHTYALGFTIDDAGGKTISADKKNVVALISVKNQYDGRYSLNGQFYHPNADYQANFVTEVEMHTSGPKTIKMFYPDFGGYYHPFWVNSASDYTAFSAQEPAYTIDPTTLKVTVQNSYNGAVTFYSMAVGYDSHYDPNTKTIYAKFGYNYGPGGAFDPAATREFTDTLKYLGPR